EVEGQHGRVGEAQRDRAGGLSEGARVDEVRVREEAVPAEVVVDRVVHAAVRLAGETEVQRGDPDVLEERREVRAGSERLHAHPGAITRLLPVLRLRGVGDLLQARAGEDGDLLLRVLDLRRRG